MAWQCCEVDERIEAAQLVRADVADVHSQGMDRWRLGAGCAAGEPTGVEPDDFMTGEGKLRSERVAEIAVVACDQDAHGSLRAVTQAGADGADQRPTLTS